ncbi:MULTISPECIES: D-serine ammonia-lyase [Comamonas]|uniref:D-serine ammonia-lyase n=1 Tax=Comamonas TaxID=283 RepID=UPI0009B8414E|nr:MULTISPECIES: D-serine ammonia-lyase [Comamonas]TZG11551.1 D-serine ammonia-lyase [Comamonas thiooxydans]UNV91419.1 D-serine ammonia-lyase [Comamonas sp. 7D-2evo1]UNV95279.1 D-serine ammonia-lyase [Comamonas sp. 7D-2]UNW01057.1 D-serine ammonia-lyase [Comamonas sp. 7D-2evo2]
MPAMTFPALRDLVEDLRHARPALWAGRSEGARSTHSIDAAQVQQAVQRFERFAPLLAQLFPGLQVSGGRIESALLHVPQMQQALQLPEQLGRLWLKADHSLPVAGSIKARGGVHEVLEYAEQIALQHGLLADGDYLQLASDAARAVFARYQVAVGSTGNLGLSIGVMASGLGFKATVHMSADAKEWKKQRLRARGVQVVEHAGDYAQAVAAGRALADQDTHCHFVDDEHSLSLLLGYAAAAPYLVAQLAQNGIAVDEMHPLFVYIPCGVGGAPGGVALGLQQAFGPHVHCFFAEPVQSPCFMVEMLAGAAALPGLEAHPSVYELGLNNQTEADGLAVPRASELAADVVRGFLGGVFTVEDETLFRHLCLLKDREGLQIEPSAAAGFSGPRALLESVAGQDYLQRQKLLPHMANATHIVWTTGGLFVPDEEYARFLARGRDLLN